MPNIGDMFPSRYLKCGDLDGREVTVTIEAVKIENVGQTKEAKPVLFFKGASKGMVLNRTNSKRIETIAGSSDTDDWTGKRIVLYPTETEFAGEVVECIRVRAISQPSKPAKPTKAAAKPQKKAKVVEPEPDDPLPEPGETADVEDAAFTPDDDDSIIPF
jgi:hypothetical protein